MQHAYSATNLASSLAAAAFTWSNAAATNRTYLNDARMDKAFSVGSVSTTVNLVIDFGSATSLSAIAVLNSNIASATAGTLKVEAADDAGISTNAVTPKALTTLATTQPRHKDHVLQFAAVSKRYWRLTWAWTGSFTLTIGEIFAASTTALTRANIYGWGESEEFVTLRQDGYSGERRGMFIAGPYRTRRMAFDDLSESERDEILTMVRASKGGASSMLWCEQYEAVSTAAAAAYQNCIYGRLELSTATWSEQDFQRYAVEQFSLRSLAREVGA